MASRRRPATVLITALIVFTLCACGGHVVSAHDISAFVNPTAATVAVHGTVNISGTIAGFTIGPVIMWWIAESKAIKYTTDCGQFPTSAAPDEATCPYGYVTFPDVSTVPSQAIYHAPSTPGTYHVVFDAIQPSGGGYGDFVEAKATCTVTVTP